jgi:hypothetical protein
MIQIGEIAKQVVKIGLLAIASAAINEELKGSTRHVYGEAKRGFEHMKEERRRKKND